MIKTGSIVRVCFLFACGVVLQPGCAYLTNKDFTDCKEFFYDNTLPVGMILGQNTRYICQLFANQVRYATVYDTGLRIPLLTAYTLDTTCKTPRPNISFWYIEPQISGYPENSMSHLNHTTPEDENNDAQLKKNQAVNLDYDSKVAGYDHGHMNPSGFQCLEGADATFTLTNAVPQAHVLNNGPWSVAETRLKKAMVKTCPDSKKYIVTGVQPGNEKINGRVTVPTIMWTAACCAKPKAGKMYSSAFYAYNTNEAKVQSVKLKALQDMIGIEIFANSCQDTARSDFDFGPNEDSEVFWNGYTNFLNKLFGHSGRFRPFRNSLKRFKYGST